MVLGGRVNKGLVSLIQQAGGRAVGLCGKDSDIIRARQVRPRARVPPPVRAWTSLFAACSRRVHVGDGWGRAGSVRRAPACLPACPPLARACHHSQARCPSPFRCSADGGEGHWVCGRGDVGGRQPAQGAGAHLRRADGGQAAGQGGLHAPRGRPLETPCGWLPVQRAPARTCDPHPADAGQRRLHPGGGLRGLGRRGPGPERQRRHRGRRGARAARAPLLGGAGLPEGRRRQPGDGRAHSLRAPRLPGLRRSRPRCARRSRSRLTSATPSHG